MSSQLFYQLQTVQDEKERSEFSKTTFGRFFNLMGYAWSAYCVWKIFIVKKKKKKKFESESVDIISI